MRFITCFLLSDLAECLEGILSNLLEDNIQVWVMKSQSAHTQVHTLLDKTDAASDQPVPAMLRACTSLKSPNLYIFTSGTTGEWGFLLLSFRTGHTYNTHVFIFPKHVMSCKWCLQCLLCNVAVSDSHSVLE